MLTVEYYTAKWCGPCKTFGPIIDAVMIEKGVNDYRKLDVEDYRELVMANSITSCPTVIFKIGEEIVYKQVGIMSYSQLVAIVDRYNSQVDRCKCRKFII